MVTVLGDVRAEIESQVVSDFNSLFTLCRVFPSLMTDVMGLWGVGGSNMGRERP